MSASEVRQAEVLGVPITCFHSYEHAVRTVVERIAGVRRPSALRSTRRRSACVVGTRPLRRLSAEGHVHICDGIGTCAAVRLLRGWRIPRVTGVRLFFELLEAAEATHLRVFLFGASPETNDAAYERLRELTHRCKLPAGSTASRRMTVRS